MKVSPGQQIGHTNEYTASTGTYTISNHIYSSLLGDLEIKNNTVQVQAKQLVKPCQGDIVIGKVTRITSKNVMVSISVVGDQVCDEFQGLIDLKNISLNCKSVGESYRPGDIIRAQVLGVDRRFILGTHAKECGVLLAMSVNGYRLNPISWVEMKCCKTGAIEKRKVAKT